MSKVLSLLVGLLTDHVTVVGWGKDARQLGIVSCAILGEIIETSWERLLLVGALNAENQCSWAAVPDLQGTDHVISVVVAAKMHVGQFGLCATLGENTVAGCYVRVASGALNGERQCS